MSAIITEPERQLAIEIRAVEDMRLVTVIELLSDANKHGAGRKDYLAKRARIIRAGANLVEIDLLHAGHRIPTDHPLPAAPYYVLVTRAEQYPEIDVWPISIKSGLPTIPIPLLPGDDDVMLDVQAAFTSVFDLLRFDRLLKYGSKPPRSLPPDELEWCKRLLTSKNYDVGGWDSEGPAV